MSNAATPRLAIIGNCQAQMIEGLFSVGADVEILPLPANFMMTAADEGRVEAALLRADFVFVQRTADDFSFPWLRSSVIKQKAPDRTLIWPNLYFDGYFPGVQYLYIPVWNKVESPLQDYHFASLIEAHKQRLSFEASLDAFVGRPESPKDPFEASLAQLAKRECDCDIIMSDVIRQAIHKQQCFLTPNHPVNALMITLVERMAERADLRLSRERCVGYTYSLDHIAIPIFDWVASQYALTFTRTTLYQGVTWSIADNASIATSGRRVYDASELVQSYLKLYDIVLPRENDF